MLRRSLVLLLLASGSAAVPAASLAYEIKPKAPESGFRSKSRPDILGVSTASNVEFGAHCI